MGVLPITVSALYCAFAYPALQPNKVESTIGNIVNSVMEIVGTRGRPHMACMATWQKTFTREPPKTKDELRAMLRQAAQNTQPAKEPEAREDQA